MNAITRYLIGAVAMALVGAVCLVAGLLDRDIAHAQEHVVSADYSEPMEIFSGAERYYEYASRLPWVGNGPVNEMRARQAALHYWQKQYVAIVPEQADPIANLPADNVDLQFLVATAMYREGLRQATDRRTTIGALDAAINAYASVLKNAVRHDDAAYNYEYVVRLKADLDKGRRKVPPPEAAEPEARRGQTPSAPADEKFKVYVPSNEREIEKSPAKAGKQEPIRKKG